VSSISRLQYRGFNIEASISSRSRVKKSYGIQHVLLSGITVGSVVVVGHDITVSVVVSVTVVVRVVVRVIVVLLYIVVVL
jgi:hypothetical protein